MKFDAPGVLFLLIIIGTTRFLGLLSLFFGCGLESLGGSPPSDGKSLFENFGVCSKLCCKLEFFFLFLLEFEDVEVLRKSPRHKGEPMLRRFIELFRLLRSKLFRDEFR